MRQDSRLSRVLHALMHLERIEGPATSELIAQMLDTNPAVVRRTMAGLRDAGILKSVKGHGGGWSLAKPLKDISLHDVYSALGFPPLFAIGNDEANPTCPLEQAANSAINDALDAARAQFIQDLKSKSVATLLNHNRQEIESWERENELHKVHTDA